MNKHPKKMAKYIPLFIILFFAAAFVFGFFVMELWNWLIPTLFGGPVVTFWQAIGILILSKILFGGLGGHGSGKDSKRSKHSKDWKSGFREECRKYKEHHEDDSEVELEPKS